jgi:uncharacterized protein YdhG (YjbR/CyaY superfamily)
MANEVDKYLQEVEPQQRAELERIRKLVKQLAPEAQESISYGMPTFKLNKKPLIHFAAFKNHMSIFPASGRIVEKMGDKLTTFHTSKGTLQFTLDKPIPEKILEEIIQERRAEITGK